MVFVQANIYSKRNIYIHVFKWDTIHSPEANDCAGYGNANKMNSNVT